MPFIKWQKTLCIGQPLVDQQHQRLVEMLNRLYEAHSDSQNNDQCMAATLTDLAHYAHDHFRDEERLMKEIGFPGLKTHEGLHNALTSDLVKILKDLRSGKELDISDLVTFLQDWLMEHIVAEDSKIGAFIRAGQRTPSAV